jgi:hypothetical protein
MLLALKLVTLVAAIAQTAGFIAFFALDSLFPWRWHLLLGGTALILLSEGASYLLVRRLARAQN